MELQFLCKEDATSLLDVLKDILATYDSVTVADVRQLVGLPTSYQDNLEGWTTLDGVTVDTNNLMWAIAMPEPKGLLSEAK